MGKTPKNSPPNGSVPYCDSIRPFLPGVRPSGSNPLILYLPALPFNLHTLSPLSRPIDAGKDKGRAPKNTTGVIPFHSLECCLNRADTGLVQGFLREFVRGTFHLWRSVFCVSGLSSSSEFQRVCASFRDITLSKASLSSFYPFFHPIYIYCEQSSRHAL